MRIHLIFALIPCFSASYSFEEEFGKSSASSDLLNPEFLMKVPESGRIEFFSIVDNDRLSQFEKSTLLTIWSQEFNVTNEHYEWAEKVKEQKEFVMQNVRAVVANISDVYSQLDSILVNITIPRRDQHSQIARLVQTFPRRVLSNNDSSPLADFFENVSRKDKTSFLNIVSNDNISYYEQNRQLTLWADQFNITNKLHNWNEQVQEQKDIVLDNVKAVVANISNVFYQLEDILVNTTLTRRAQHSQIDRLAETFPREVRALFFIARHYRPENTSPIFGKEAGNGETSQNQMTPFGFPAFKTED
ncbi:hypothetical protein GCK72_019346 [Caenorhabditis remanei]|uniref:SXP/RAL-2 family protein Ani s 5-like cation-binding domain-containing protein n=1 Tax=Caenorhabditis remanei TaxID=31234 RepID=A0A6A5GDJ3_CAERE|nr:hypothetical protein GCK72_019346 [Caenorhabditis remanei]KAF1752791.1 hypothetical protein GCK72_019346 [Caenorhabditis remanei]